MTTPGQYRGRSRSWRELAGAISILTVFVLVAVLVPGLPAVASPPTFSGGDLYPTNTTSISLPG